MLYSSFSRLIKCKKKKKRVSDILHLPESDLYFRILFSKKKNGK